MSAWGFVSRRDTHGVVVLVDIDVRVLDGLFSVGHGEREGECPRRPKTSRADSAEVAEMRAQGKGAHVI
jgi:hypothetical protein